VICLKIASCIGKRRSGRAAEEMPKVTGFNQAGSFEQEESGADQDEEAAEGALEIGRGDAKNYEPVTLCILVRRSPMITTMSDCFFRGLSKRSRQNRVLHNRREIRYL